MYKKTIIGLLALVLLSSMANSAVKKSELPKPAIARISSYLEGIINMKVKLGQKVRKGDLLFNVKTDYAETVRKKYQNEVWYYTQIFNRIRELQIRKSESVDAMQSAKYNMKKAVGDLNIEDLQIDKWSKYYAPFDGVVTRIYYYSGSATPDEAGHPQHYNSVMEVMKLSDYKKLEAAGYIKQPPEVANVASMVEGIVEMKVQQGQKVKKGQELFSINMEYNKILKEQQEANLNLCKAQYEREKRLYKENANALKEYQEAQYNYVNAAENLAATNLIINKRSVYCAPFDGYVSNIIHYSGSNAFAGHTILQVTKG